VIQPVNDRDDSYLADSSSEDGSHARRQSAGRSAFLPATMWLVVLFALAVSVMIGLFEFSLRPVIVNERIFSTVNITVEVLRVTFAFGVFGVVWLTREFGLDRRNLVIAVTFLSVGVLTIFRLLTFPDMPSVGGATENISHSLYFSLFIRYTIGAAMLGTLFIRKGSPATKDQYRTLLAVTAIYLTFVVAIVLFPGTPLPDIQHEGTRLNPVLAELEFGTMALAFLAAVGYARIAVALNDMKYGLVAVGLILFAQASFAFMESPTSEDAVFLVGRATSLVGFFLVFLAIMKTALRYPYLKLDSATRDFKAIKSDVDRKTSEMRTLAQDLTERKLAEAALRKSEKSYRDLIETATEGIWKTDAAIRTTFVNPQMAKMLGYNPGEMIGRPMAEFVEPGFRAIFENHLEQRRRGVRERYELPLVKKNGEKAHFLISATPMLDELGEFIGSVAFFTDITERKEMEDALRESERTLFRFLVDLPVGIIVSDPNGSYLFSNDRARQILGKDVDPSIPSEETTEFYEAHIVGTDQLYPRERAPITRALAGEASMVDDIEIHKPNETIQLEVWGAPVTDQDGTVLYGIAAFQDITERKESERLVIELNKSLEVQAKRLADINRELEAFAYSISHDLRAPLRTIDGFSTILSEHYSESLDDKGKDYLKRVKAGCQRMGQLIDDMLKLSRITRDEMTWERVDLSKIARSVLSDMRKAQPDRKVKLVVEDGVVVQGDERLYRILMTNLLENAWKFCQKQPRPVIEFGVTAISGEKVLFVKDNGAGFDMKNADKLFVPFQRLHSSVEFAGTGIGLATAQRIVHRHGGKIWAEGEVGKGATFYFTEGRGGTTSETTT
jgi:PAS domain S-box-containing protein